MDRSPRNPKESLFSLKTLTFSIMQGFIALICVLGAYLAAINFLNQSVPEARSLAFVTLVISNIGIILSNRSFRNNIFKILLIPNKALLWVCGGAIVFLGLIIYVPFLQNIFHFKPLHLIDLAVALGTGIFAIICFEVLKFFTYRLKKDAD